MQLSLARSPSYHYLPFSFNHEGLDHATQALNLVFQRTLGVVIVGVDRFWRGSAAVTAAVGVAVIVSAAPVVS